MGFGVFTPGQGTSPPMGWPRTLMSPVPSTRETTWLTGPGSGKIFIGPQMLLPSDKVRHVGEAVAVVVAGNRGSSPGRGRSGDSGLRGTALDCRGAGRVDAGRAGRVDRSPTTFSSTSVSATPRRPSACLQPPTKSSKWKLHIGRVTGVAMEPRAALGH